MFPLVFFDVDTQRDFIEETGALAVPMAAALRDALRILTETARALQIPILASCDAHAKDDPEFKDFPPHCIVGTRGAEKIPETWVRGSYLVPASGRRRPWIDEKNWRQRGGEVVLETASLDPFANPAAAMLLKSMEPRRVAVYGVATEYGVRYAVLNCINLGIAEVYLVRDAVKGLTEEGEHQALVEMADRGARYISTHDLCVQASGWMKERR